VKKSVIQYVKSCDLCQQVKAQRLGKQGELILIVPDSKPWSTIGMDMITKLLFSGGFDSVLVVIDLLSKLTHFIPFKESSSLAVLANAFRTNIFRLHGIPNKIISDQGSKFVSEFWKSFMNLLNIKAGFSAAYHPQTDGQTEQMNQVLEDYLRHFCSYYQDNWDKILDMAEFSINNLTSGSLGVSPFFFTYGNHPKFSILTETSGRSNLDEFICDLQETQETAIECLTQA
jgi:transposase InsO family protein